MPSSVTGPMYDGEPMSFPEFATRTARVVSPWAGYERDTPLDVPLPDSFVKTLDYDEKYLNENIAELVETVGWSAEEADNEAHLFNLSRLKTHIQMIRVSRPRVQAYRYMSTQVAAWRAPTEEHEVMRAVMQNQLDETFGYDVKHVGDLPPEKITGAEYREIVMQGLAQSISHRRERIDSSAKNIDEMSAFAKAFKDSLENWVDVPLPVRILPK